MPQVYHSLEDHHSPIAAVPKGTLGNGETLAAILLCVAIFQTSASQGLIRTYCCRPLPCPCQTAACSRKALRGQRIWTQVPRTKCNQSTRPMVQG